MGKSTILLILLLGLCTSAPLGAAPNTISLEEALKKNLVKATIQGKGGYYGECIKLTLSNKSRQNLSLSIEAGRRLNCVYDSVQDMMITKAQILALLPSQTKEFTIYAMCSEKHDRGPNSSSEFNLGAMAQSQLVKLAQLIEKLDAQNMTGQKAVWVITDGISADEIRGENTVMVTALKEFVRNAGNTYKKTEREPGFIYDYSYPQTDGNVYTIEGDFTWEMPRSGIVSLYIYDNNGNRLLAIFQDQSANQGLQSYHYKISDEAFEPGEMYWVRMKQNGRTIKELAVTMD